MGVRIVVVTAGRNSGANFEGLCASVDAQTDTTWRHIVVDDASDPGRGLADASTGGDPRREVRLNMERRWALQNIVGVAREHQDDPDVVIATVDADDELCEPRALELVLRAYEEDPNRDVVWTGHRWDVRADMNVSRAMPSNVDPYEWPWCSSHLRTFRASLLKKVSDANFKDHRGEWFRRGYDQALMLPLLKVGRGRCYIDAPCYLYRMDSCSIPLTERAGTEVEQLHNIAFLRARGFVG